MDGATLVIRAACPEGLGSESGFRAALSGCRPPWSSLLTGDPPLGPGAQRAVVLAMVSRRYRIRVEGCNDPDLFQSLGIDASPGFGHYPSTWLRVPRPFQQLPQIGSPPATG